MRRKEDDSPGIPQLTLIPAPVRTKIFLLDAIRDKACSHVLR